MKYGYDISKYQKGADLYKAKQDGMEFVIMRIAHGDSKDECFENFYKQAKQINVPIGVYVYGVARTDKEAEAEASYCASLLQRFPITLPIFYDVEGESGMAGILYPGPKSPYTVASVVNSFLKQMRSLTSNKVGIYSSSSCLKNQLSSFLNDNNTPLWVAEWDVSGYPFPDFATNIYMHQYTVTTATGFSGKVDHDQMKDDSIITTTSEYYFHHPLGDLASGSSGNVLIKTYEGHGPSALDIMIEGLTNQQKLGTPIYSMCDGYVDTVVYDYGSMQKTSSGGGNYIGITATDNTKRKDELDQGTNVRFIYCHLVKPKDYPNIPTLTKGQEVVKGQIIGGMGGSGHTESSTSPDGICVHLHVEAKSAGNYFTFGRDQTAMEKYSGKTVAGRTVGNNYNYAIFSNTPTLTTIYTEASTGGTAIVSGDKCKNVPSEYFTKTFTEQDIANGSGMTYDAIIQLALGLAAEETICYIQNSSGTELELAYGAYCTFAKLLRCRMIYDNTTLYKVLYSGAFSGGVGNSAISYMSQSQVDHIKTAFANNIMKPEAYNIPNEYLQIVQNGPYYNFGYASIYDFEQSIEEELYNKIINKQVDSHIKEGNSDICLGCYCNTAYFPPRSWE